MTALPLGFFGGGDAREVSPGTFFIPAFANSAALSTPEGILLVDCGLQIAGEGIRHQLRTLTQAPVAAVVFTHGHVDHAFGIGAFDEEAEAVGRARPRRYAHRLVGDRFRRYARTRSINEHINRTQFGVGAVSWPETYPWPDVTYDDRHPLELGGERFELRHARGETDDATWVWAPARKVLLTGDLFIWSSPNCGNPQKVQRYAEGWADALDEMRALGAEVLLPGHGPPIEGREAVATALEQTSRWLRSLVEQTLRRMAQGERADDIAGAVQPPADLAEVPYLQPLYDRPEFVVRNVMRLHGGWWNGNPADLLPATEAARAREIADLAGGVAALCARARALVESDAALACHLAEWAALAAPAEPEAQRTKRDVFTARAAAEPSLMARNIFLAAARAAQKELDAAEA
jgi:glyoxylase-like metal-dependent hydrolase (beta-lactamase superfamily II)